ncbi:MAG: AAA family ATPase [Spirochaetales bacterium]
MRPIKLALENFGPYRDRAEIDFSQLGEFFLICGKTGSGKSTLFDAITYALFGQAPGGRKGSEAEFVSDFAAPGGKPAVEFEFSLSGTRYRVSRTAPFSRPKKGGGFTDVPPTATLFAASAEAEGGWRVVSDGVRDTNERVPILIGLSAEEFSKIILLPQGDFQKFLEMESTERSQVLEKLFPVDLHERMAEIAKAKTQEAKTELSLLEAEIGRLAAEAGEDSEANLAGLRVELEKALAEESAAMGEAAARERALERERDRAARAARAMEAAKALVALEERASVEATRAARISLAKAAATVAPFSLAFSKARAAARDLSERAARLAAVLSSLEASGAAIQAKRLRIKECAVLTAAKQEEMFGLQKAVEVWNRRAGALVALAEAEALAADLEGRYAREIAGIEAQRRDLEALRPKPEEEAKLRGDVEKLQALGSSLALLSEQSKRGAGLFADRARAEASRREYEASRVGRLAESERAAATLSGLEAALARSEAARLAGSLAPGEPCPVCGSLEHPKPARAAEDEEAIPPGKIEAARSRFLKVSGEIAGLDSSLRHADERLKELDSELEARGKLLGETAAAISGDLAEAGILPRGREREEVATFVAGFDEAAAAAFAGGIGRLSGETAAAIGERKALASRFEARRLGAAEKEKTLTEKTRALEELRARLETARADLVAKKTLLAEAERGSGPSDPEPAFEAARQSLAALEAEKAGLEAECSRWEESLATARATSSTILGERDAAFASLAAEFARLSESLNLAGFMPAAPGSLWAEPAPAPDVEAMLGEERGGLAAALSRAESAALPPATLAAEESAAIAYRDARVAARAKAASLEADLPAPGTEAPDLAALEAALGEARAVHAAARSRSDACRLSISGLEATLARRFALEKKRGDLEEGSRSLYRLSELLLGKIPGRQLPFKNFVLAMYFREVTMRASIHLSHMSDGRYYLKPDEVAAKGVTNGAAAGAAAGAARGAASRTPGRGKIGLGLRVLDAWTGLDRPTATLSGGEKFLTSISLALGLADSIRDQNGGVSLDAVFIDEGFGSLDDEALDRAITVLDKIRGSRVIGIVSHVAGLKARIPARIEVEKTASGSRLSQSAMFSDQAL